MKSATIGGKRNRMRGGWAPVKATESTHSGISWIRPKLPSTQCVPASPAPVSWDPDGSPRCPGCNSYALAYFVGSGPLRGQPRWMCVDGCGWWHVVTPGSVEAFAHARWKRHWTSVRGLRGRPAW